MRRTTLALICAAAATPAAAREPLLTLPVDCTLGADCFIQNYVDADPGPGHADFTCGPLSYDGHKGTDFAVPSLAAMQAGVVVRPAANGTVIGVRDGMPDTGPDASGGIDGRECGNGVVIRHGAGWESQYCHLREGSVAVEIGQRVNLSTELGKIGLSGNTDFPHLHMSLRKDGETVDPFAPDGRADCAEAPTRTLWLDAPDYVPGGILDTGFADAIPDYDRIKAGSAATDRLAPDAPALVLWGYLFGGRAGDTVRLVVEGPSGAVLDETVTLDKTQAQLFRAIGRRLPDDGWTPGSYTGTVIHSRGDTRLDAAATAVTVAR
ncbi:M23 family metallopeptidase [Rhodobacteraceae bacterium CCMM004]|nr:M23 family metallopeptidase [Rhodobacteraceae bacterium CCMM004]